MRKSITRYHAFYLFIVCLLGCSDQGGSTGNPVDSDSSTSPSGDTDSTACEGGEWMVCDCDGASTGVTLCEDGTFGDCACHTGELEFDRVCGVCHGDFDNPAPPVDVNGETDTASMTVGTHREHLKVSDWHRRVQCADCHAVPEEIESEGHIDDSPAELTWSSLSAAGNAIPRFNPVTGTCSDTYCHGATLTAGGGNTAPTWNLGGEGEATCGSCHGLPPAGDHPDSSDCETCHSLVMNDAFVFEAPELHIDGTVQMGGGTDSGCNTCHGGADNDAPPLDTLGNDDTGLVTVGAHQSHVTESDWHRDFSCTDCHVVPTAVGDPTHMDGAPAEITWGTLAGTGGLTPAFTRADGACANTWCHGSGLSGGAHTTPIWMNVGTGEAACGNCHGFPPGGSHPANTQCGDCHGAVYDGTGWVDDELHIDGTVQVSGGYHDLTGWTTPGGGVDHHGSNYFITNGQMDEHDAACTDCHGAGLDGGTSGVSCDNTSCHGGDWRSCTFCHGTPAGSNSPPNGVGGETATTTLAVGRHGPHDTYGCETCHAVPPTGDVAHAVEYVPSSSLDDPGHHGNVAFFGAATVGMTWDVTGTAGTPIDSRGTCLGGCHSNGRGDNPNVTPYWAGIPWSGSTCGNCHNVNPGTFEHDKHVLDENMDCTDCHPDASTASHADGDVDVNASIFGITVTMDACSGGNYPTCDGMCHGRNHNNWCWD